MWWTLLFTSINKDFSIDFSKDFSIEQISRSFCMPALLVGNRSVERKYHEKNVTVDFSLSSMTGRYLKIQNI